MIQKTRSKLLRERYYFTTLTCGLPVFFIPKKGYRKKLVAFTTHYGSIDQEFGVESSQKKGRGCSRQGRASSQGVQSIKMPAGVAHFLEHQLFKKESGDISQEFARYGAYYNAYTGYHITSYFFGCTDNFQENLRILTRLVFAPYFSPPNVAQEKLIIEQEVKMYEDMPDLKMMKNLLKSLYHYHSVRIDIAGTLESIKEITPEILQRCYTTFYHPTNMVAVIAGELDFEMLRKELNHLFDGIIQGGLFNKRQPEELIQRKMPTEPATLKNTRAVARMVVSRPQILLGFKELQIGLEGEKQMLQNIAMDLLLEIILGRGSRLYNQLYNDGLIDDHFSSSYNAHKTYGFTILGGETDQPEVLHKRLLKGLKQVQKKRIKKRDLARLKRKFLGRFIQSFDLVEPIVMMFPGYYFNKLDPFEYPNYLKKVGLKQIEERLFEHLNERNHAVSIIEPNNLK